MKSIVDAQQIMASQDDDTKCEDTMQLLDQGDDGVSWREKRSKNSSDKDTRESFKCMKDVTVYYPSREDKDAVQVTYTDMECLHPGQWLSSAIMNFYIRFIIEESSYLQSDNFLDPPFKDEIWGNFDSIIIHREVQIPRQGNSSDCGLFVLYYMERFIKEAPKRLREEDLSLLRRP